MLNARNDQKSHQEALNLLYESADLGYSASFIALGRLHLKAQFELPPADAVSWFERGADAGHGGAFHELAKLYMAGEWVERNLVEARSLALEGKKRGHRGSANLIRR